MIARIMMIHNWQRLYDEASSANPLKSCHLIAAYNEVVDEVYRLRDDDIDELRKSASVPLEKEVLDDFKDFSAALDYGLRNGVASEVHASNGLFRQLEAKYAHRSRIGGQAAIIGTIISRFSDHPPVIHPDRMDELLGELLKGERLLAPIIREGQVQLVPPEEIRSEMRSERHLIFEFSEGQRGLSGGVCPRHNRLIVDPLTSIHFDPAFDRGLPEIAQECDLFVVAGLDHMGDDYEPAFQRVATHTEKVRASNPDAILHLEITSMTDSEKINAVIDEIIPLFDSMGLNEAELQTLYLAADGNATATDGKLSPRQQLDAMEALLDRGIRRVHMHTLGYYLRAGETKNIGSSIRAMIFSGAVVCAAALKGDFPYIEDLKGLALTPSKRGLETVENLSDHLIHNYDAEELPEKEGTGIICVPAPIVENQQLTVGLGDCVSGTAIAAEKMMGAM